MANGYVQPNTGTNAQGYPQNLGTSSPNFQYWADWSIAVAVTNANSVNLVDMTFGAPGRILAVYTPNYNGSTFNINLDITTNGSTGNGKRPFLPV